MAEWNATQYLKFEKERTQPSIDLIKRIDIEPRSIIDVGSGPGNSTAVLHRTFPTASIVGIDSSEDMIEKAKAKHPELSFKLEDARSLEGRYDLIFSNACLQWIPDHHTLLPFLMEHLNDGGVLAVQIPMNGNEPFFKLIDELASDWNLSLDGQESNRTLEPEEYYNILSSASSSFNIWEVKYYHRMESHAAMAEWVKGTRLRPYLAALKERGDEFVAELVERAKPLYPLMADGTVLLGFRRFFFTAKK